MKQIKQYSKEYYQKNKDKIKLRSKEYIQKHKDSHREYQQRYREKNKDYIKEYHKLYHIKNKKRCRICNRRLLTPMSIYKGLCVVCNPPAIWGIDGLN